MKVAVLGGGISGISAACFLDSHVDVTIFETSDYLGGHTDTHTIVQCGEPVLVDSGFIVFNRLNYPQLSQWFDRNRIQTHKTNMSFGYANAEGLEYGTNDLGALFAQARNIANPKFLQMLGDTIKFYRDASRVKENDQRTVREYLNANNYSSAFSQNHLLPMCAALWSAIPNKVQEMPISHVAVFMTNHGFTTIGSRPKWEVLEGGSYSYVESFRRQFTGSIRLSTPVRFLLRNEDKVVVETDTSSEDFDYVVVACHADQALDVLDATASEQEILGAIEFQTNRAVLHSDPSVMPKNKKAWSSWNVYENAKNQYEFTYWMNCLQLLETQNNYFVTLNPQRELRNVHVEREYSHPIYTHAARSAQQSKNEICGFNRTTFAGAYWGWGFHEDGFASGMEAGVKVREMAQC